MTAKHFRTYLICAAMALFGLSAPALAQFSASGPEKEFFDAMEDGNEAEFSRLLITLSPHIRGRERVPALIAAVESKNAFFVAELIKKGARPDDSPPDRRTALTRAAELNQLAMVRILLDAGADPDLEGATGETALITAARLGYDEIVRALLDAGADKDLGDLTGRTAQEAAARSGFHHIARMLEDAE